MLKSFDIFEATEYTVSYLQMPCLMKIKNLWALACLFAANTAFSQAPPADAATAGKEFLNAITEENATALRSLMGNDFILLSFDGQSVDSATLLEAVGSGYVVIDSGNTYSNYTRHYQDTGIITGIWNVKGSIQGQSFSNQLAYTLVAVRQGGSWKIVSVQFTPS